MGRSQEVCELAGWGDEKLDFVKEKLTSEATQQDITKGKSPEQVRRGERCGAVGFSKSC